MLRCYLAQGMFYRDVALDIGIGNESASDVAIVATNIVAVLSCTTVLISYIVKVVGANTIRCRRTVDGRDKASGGVACTISTGCLWVEGTTRHCDIGITSG